MTVKVAMVPSSPRSSEIQSPLEHSCADSFMNTFFFNKCSSLLIVKRYCFDRVSDFLSKSESMHLIIGRAERGIESQEFPNFKFTFSDFQATETKIKTKTSRGMQTALAAYQ